MQLNGLQLTADFHTHTILSHGKGTIEQNVRAAIEKGLKTVAVTDHGYAHVAYGMIPRETREARREVDKLNQRYQRDIRILLGVEANLTSLDGTTDIGREKRGYFDIVLMGHHKAVLPKTVKDFWHFIVKNELKMNRRSNRDTMRALSTSAYIQAIEKYDIDIIVHPMYAIEIDILMLAGACRDKGTAIEINSSHVSLSDEAILLAKTTGVKFVIDSDAHIPSRVGDFQAGLDAAVRTGLTPADIINAQGYSGQLPANLGRTLV